MIIRGESIIVFSIAVFVQSHYRVLCPTIFGNVPTFLRWWDIVPNFEISWQNIVWAISSGTTLFAQTFFQVCSIEGLK